MSKFLFKQNILHLAQSAIYLFLKHGPQLSSALCDKHGNPEETVKGNPVGMLLLHSVHDKEIKRLLQEIASVKKTIKTKKAFLASDFYSL